MKKKLLWFCICVFLVIPLLAVLTTYCALRSERFVLGYLLPFVSEKAGVQISASKASVKLFSEISFEGLDIHCDQADKKCQESLPLSLKASSLKVAYDLWHLVSRQLVVTSLTGTKVDVNFTAGSTSTPSATAASTATLQSTPAPTPESNSVGFSVKIANVALRNSSFRYLDPSSNSQYTLEQIKLDIPNANSHGDSVIQLSTRVSITSKGLTLKNEILAGSVTLRDSKMFAPKKIEVVATAGSASPAPLELNGSLIFSADPYAAQKVSITKATVRESLFTLLGIKREPVSDFEYEVRGDYPFKQPAPSNVTIVVNKAIVSPSSHNLKGSQISSTLQLYPDSISITKGSVELVTNGAKAAKIDISGSIAFDPYSKQSKLTIQAPEIDFDQLQALTTPSAQPADDSTGQANTTPSTSDQTKSPTETAQASTSIPPQMPQLPLVSASLKVDKAAYQKMGISNINADLAIPASTKIERATLGATFDGAGTVSASVAGDLNSTLSVKAKAEQVNVLPFAALAQKSGELLEGNIDLFDLDISLAPKTPRTTLTGRAKLKLSRFIVPSTLHGQVPFNILFLPFDALITVFGGTLNALLPASISSISDGIRQVLDDAGRLGIDKGVIDLAFDQGKISCQQVEIDTKNLPDFTIKGSVSASDSLDFTIFIALLKLHLPLPVAGTLSAPLPDVVYLGPEIVRGLGLSIGNIAGGIVSITGGSSESPSAPPAAKQNAR